MPIAREPALILRRFAYGETSLVVHVLCPERGRVHVLAKGAYRPTSRFFAVLDLFDTLELEWSYASGRELSILRQASIRERRTALARDLARYRAALAVLELAAMAAREAQSAPGLFASVSAALDALCTPAAVPHLELTIFELAFLRELGLSPALVSCAACGTEPAADRSPLVRVAFAAGAGGRLCRRCAEEARRSGRRVVGLGARTLSLAAELAALPVLPGSPAAPRPRISGPDLDRVRDFVVRFLEYHLESRPKSYRRPFRASPAPPRTPRPSAP